MPAAGSGAAGGTNSGARIGIGQKGGGGWKIGAARAGSSRLSRATVSGTHLLKAGGGISGTGVQKRLSSGAERADQPAATSGGIGANPEKDCDGDGSAVE